MGRNVYDKWDVDAVVYRESFTLDVGDMFVTSCDYLYEDLDDMIAALAAVKRSAAYRRWRQKPQKTYA